MTWQMTWQMSDRPGSKLASDYPTPWAAFPKVNFPRPPYDRKKPPGEPAATIGSVRDHRSLASHNGRIRPLITGIRWTALQKHGL